MKYNKGFIGLGMVVVIIGVLVVGGVVYFNTKTPTPTLDMESNNQVSNEEKSSENNKQNQNIYTLTQAQAESLVHQTWGNCSQGDCSGVTVSVTQNSNGQYVVTAIFTELDDSVSQTKRVSVAVWNNGIWTLGQPTITRMCHRGNNDGTAGWTAGLCV